MTDKIKSAWDALLAARNTYAEELTKCGDVMLSGGPAFNRALAALRKSRNKREAAIAKLYAAAEKTYGKPPHLDWHIRGCLIQGTPFEY